MQQTLTGEPTEYTATNKISFNLMNGMCYACNGHHFCPHSDTPLGQAVTEYMKKGKECFVLATMKPEEEEEL